MNENETTATQEERTNDDARETVDMEQFEFMILLMESRIIQPSW